MLKFQFILRYILLFGNVWFYFIYQLFFWNVFVYLFAKLSMSCDCEDTLYGFRMELLQAPCLIT